MGIVRFALRFPHTFYVLAALLVFLGFIAIHATRTDIFPEIRIPVVSVIWSYNGLSTPEMEQRVTTYSQYAMSSSVNGIKNMESQTLNGVAVVKIYLQPGTDMAGAMAQVTAVSQTVLRRMPPGTNPPLIMRYSASSVPVIQLSLSSDTLSESELYDYGIYNLRQQLAVVQGTTLPLPYGGAPRQIMVEGDPARMRAHQVTLDELMSTAADAVDTTEVKYTTGAAVGSLGSAISVRSPSSGGMSAT